jgi:hypothetical protein
MKRVKTYEQFVNEENLFKKAAIGTALGASLLGGSPQAIGQEVDKTEITGKYGVNEIEDAKGTELKDKSYFEDLMFRVAEISANSGKPLTKKFQIIKVEHLEEWQQYRVYLKQQNVVAGQTGEEIVYIPEEMFEDFLNTGNVNEHILNIFVTLEGSDDPEYFQRGKRKPNTYYLPGYKL